MTREQRRQEVVTEVLRALADVARKEVFFEEIEKGLLRVERGGDEMFRADHVAIARFDADRAAGFDDDALGLGAEPDLAARCAHRRFERARERRRAAARHLRLRAAREQPGGGA